ncbi:MAG: hypothetical protein ACXABY_19335 [Candidatus Thorarchaeota archaeon]|jgi:hypothetical protein
MIGSYVGWDMGFAGTNAVNHNVAFLNVEGILRRGWCDYDIFPLFKATWSTLGHEVGHGYGIPDHPMSDDIMDVGLTALLPPSGLYRPWSSQFSAGHQAFIEPKLGMFYEENWYLDSWTHLTDPSLPNAMPINGYSISLEGYDGYHVDTLNDPGYDDNYDFFAYGATLYLPHYGEISGSGRFRFYDTFTSSGNQYLKVYILDHVSRDIIDSAYVMTYSDGVGVWKWKTFTVSGLAAGWYVVAFGRYDDDQYDKEFTAEWVGVSIYNYN